MTNLIYYPLIMLIHVINSQTVAPSAGTLTTAQKQYLLDMHNDVRNEVASGTYNGNAGVALPSATNMNELLWDDGLAALASNYSEQCVFAHSGWNTDNLQQYAAITSFEIPATSYLGENLAVATLTPVEFNDTYGVTGGVQGWIDEGLGYGYGTIPAPSPQPTEETCTVTACGHFTQVIWAGTRYVGCGYTDCDGVAGFAYAMNLVCLYYTAGNFESNYPYESGTVCSNCDGDRTSNCDAGYRSGLCAGGVDSSFDIDSTTVVDTCDNGLGQALPNAVCAPTSPPTTIFPTANPTAAPTLTQIVAPTSASPTTAAPTTASPTTTSPTTRAPSAAPTLTQIVTPTSASPTTAQPTTNSPTTSNPTTTAPTTASPTTSQPTVTPAPITPAPITPAPTTPNPTTPAPITPAPTTPAPITPAPVTPAPTTPSPTTPSPITPAPVTPAPTTPSPVTPAPTTPSPTTPAPVTPAPTTPAPVTPAPTTPAPVTPAPVTPAPTTPRPTTPAPITPAPTTPAPITPAPTTPSPTTPAPVTPSPTTPNPTTPEPTTPAPITPSPTTPLPTTPAPTTPAPVGPGPIINSTTTDPTTTVSVAINATNATTIITTEEGEQCPELDLEIALFYIFYYDAIQGTCDICLSEGRRGRRVRRGCKNVADFLNGYVDEYGQCMLNVCDYDCTLDRLQLNEDVNDEEICGCNIFECGALSVNAAYNGKLCNVFLIIALSVLFNFFCMFYVCLKVCNVFNE